MTTEKEMTNIKSLGPDGFTAEFDKKCRKKFKATAV